MPIGHFDKYSAFLACALLFTVSASAQSSSTVTIRLNETLSTGSIQRGDTFTGTLESPLIVQDRIVAERDTLVTGQVRDVISSGRLKRPALITLKLSSVHSDSGRIPIEAGSLTIKAESHGRRNLIIIGESAGLGGLIGGAAAGGKGVLVGSAAGAGAGVIGAYITGREEIVLPSETVLTFHVNSVVISQRELGRLQRVRQYDDVVILRQRHHHHHGDDDDDDDDHDHDHDDD